MYKIQKQIGVILLVALAAVISGCGKSGGGGASNGNEATTLEEIGVPGNFNFLTTKTVDVTIPSQDHSITGDGFIKVALDDQYQYTLYLGPLKDGDDFRMRFTVPSRASLLYYKIYQAGTEPYQGQISL